MKNKTTILMAIETSCDETGVAVVHHTDDDIEILSSGVASQIDVHKLTGGVVPNVAAREHSKVIGPLIKEVWERSGVSADDMDGVAVTVGPGLKPALVVGVTAAQTAAYAWDKPVVPVHHLEGHIYSALLDKVSETKYVVAAEKWPVLALIVSGGHTMLIKMKEHVEYQILGSTRDDAAGEAFDKVGRLLGLPYPGGPEISALAKKGNREAFQFARPMLQTDDFDFSFSGLKTDVLYRLRDLKKEGKQANKADVAASFQQAVVDVLMGKTKRAMDKYNPQVVVLAGGVAANESLRQQLRAVVEEERVEFKVAPQELCGDNAVMIGQAALMAYNKKRIRSWRQIDALPRVSIEEYSV